MEAAMKEDHEGVVVEEEPPPTPGGSSLLDGIKAKREERIKDEYLDLPIPTWDGDLVARYRVVDRTRMEKLAAKVQQAQRRGLQDSQSDIDFLIMACEAVLIRDPESGNLEAIIDDETGLQVAYDATLARKLGVEVEKAREVVLYLFNSNAVAIGAQAMKIGTWMQDTSQEVDGAVLGE